MGNTCSPDKKNDDKKAPTDMEKQEALDEAQESGAQPGEKLTQVINAYQAENEKLKKTVEELKTQETERADQESSKSEGQDELLKELNTMRALVHKKDQDLVKSKVQSALFQHVSTMKDDANAAVTLKKDTLEKFGKAGKGSAKSKFVTVSLHKGTRTPNGFEPGMIRLSYAENESAAQLSTGRVTKVKTADKMAQKWKGRTFSVEAVMDGSSKDLVFACADTETRDAWVKVFQDGFDRIRLEAENMRQHFQLTLTFSKEKLGIRVEEKVIEEAPCQDNDQEKKDDDIPAPAAEEPKVEDKADATAEDDIPAPAEAEKEEAAKEDGEAAEEPAAPAEEAEQAAAPAAEVEEKEPPCTLVVTAISDEELLKEGLCESMALMKLNDAKIDGLPYSKQLGMLTGTDKPFTITFSGPNFLKLGQNKVTVFPAILKQLTADEPNDAQAAFKAIIKDSKFEGELNAAADKEESTKLITELLSNQQKLQNLLQSVTTHSADL